MSEDERATDGGDGRDRDEPDEESRDGLSENGAPRSDETGGAAQRKTTAEDAAAATLPAKSKKRQRKAPIDIDEHIETARAKMKEAQKMVTAAKTQARNEKRKKQRLVKKAATLTSEDLERIAVWKRSGLDMTDGRFLAASSALRSAPSNASASSSAGGSPALPPAAIPTAAHAGTAT